MHEMFLLLEPPESSHKTLHSVLSHLGSNSRCLWRELEASGSRTAPFYRRCTLRLALVAKGAETAVASVSNTRIPAGACRRLLYDVFM